MKTILFVSMLLLCSVKAFAYETTIRCENCENYQAAAENAYVNAGEYTVHVWDMTQEVIKRQLCRF